jgi:hypothetical protein
MSCITSYMRSEGEWMSNLTSTTVTSTTPHWPPINGPTSFTSLCEGTLPKLASHNIAFSARCCQVQNATEADRCTFRGNPPDECD